MSATRTSERPATATLTVIYDGHCRFCTGQVERFARWDRRGRLEFLSLHDPATAARFPQLSHEELMRDMYVVDLAGNAHKGAAAFRELSRVLPRLWWMAPLLHLPGSMPLWQWLYGQFAARRYLFGQTGSCENGTCAVGPAERKKAS